MAEDEIEEVACPVCGKSVGLDVSSCPYCGAEFEEEEVSEEEEASEEPKPVEAKPAKGKGKGKPAKAAATEPEPEPVTSDEAGDVACPVCGVMVGIDISSCPKCGAEFEEEEIEEVIEVEETTAFEAEPEPAPVEAEPPDLTSSLMDFRVIGVALIILGIIGTQIALMRDWYYGWVPPIEDNLVLFVVIPVVLLVVGILAFMLLKKAMSSGKEVPGSMPGLSLSLFMFGILALVVIVLWDPINAAMQDSRAMVAGAFAVALVLGIVLVFMGSRRASSAASD